MTSRLSVKETYQGLGCCLALLAMIWLAAGAHSVHPFFHLDKAPYTAVHKTSHTGGSAARQSGEAGFSATGETHHHSCSVCEFFKTCHLNILWSEDLYLAADFSYLQPSVLPIALPFYERRDYPIRGPPLVG